MVAALCQLIISEGLLVSRVQQLYQLQNLDSEIDLARQRLAEVKAKQVESPALKSARTAVEEAERGLRKSRATMQDLDLEVKSLAEKISREEKALYSGSRKLSAKEASNLQDEVASLHRRHENREELLLEAMVAAEEAQQNLEMLRQELASVEAGWAADQEGLRQEQSTLETRITQLGEQRPTLAGAVSEADLAQYQALRQQKGGRAIVLVKNGTCQGCGMMASNSKVQKARQGSEFITCGGCGRILYVS